MYFIKVQPLADYLPMQALEGLLADAEQLSGSIHSTAELSERVSKVRSCTYLAQLCPFHVNHNATRALSCCSQQQL